jgi:hypothetical protein
VYWSRMCALFGLIAFNLCLIRCASDICESGASKAALVGVRIISAPSAFSTSFYKFGGICCG